MALVPLKNVIYLNSSQELPGYLQSVKGVIWHKAQDTNEFRRILASQTGEVLVVVKADFLSLGTLESIMQWAQSHTRLSFIFIIQAIEKSAYQMSLNHSNCVFVYESEGARITEVVTRRVLGKLVKSRRQERLPVKSPVMLKKSLTENAPQGGRGVQFLKEGEMNDFSKGGAKISIASSGVKVKDFISLMYRNSSGVWVSVESQVRWVVSTASGSQVIGVQFLAVST